MQHLHYWIHSTVVMSQGLRVFTSSQSFVPWFGSLDDRHDGRALLVYFIQYVFVGISLFLWCYSEIPKNVDLLTQTTKERVFHNYIEGLPNYEKSFPLFQLFGFSPSHYYVFYKRIHKSLSSHFCLCHTYEALHKCWASLKHNSLLEFF